jgi:hypothetical protein
MCKGRYKIKKLALLMRGMGPVYEADKIHQQKLLQGVNIRV